jgi:hypothetical protein
VYQALYLAFVPPAAEPDHEIEEVILDGDLTAPSPTSADAREDR